MTEDVVMTPVSAAAIAVEVALCLSGLWLLWRQTLGPGARAFRQPARLSAWNVSGSDFLLLLCLVVLGAFAATSVAGLLTRWRKVTSDGSLVLGGAAMQCGVLAGFAAFHFGYRPRGAGAPSMRQGILRMGAATFVIALPLVIGFGNAWESLLKLCGLPAEKQPLVEILESTHSIALKAILIVVATLLVPVAEELFFRAGLFRYLRTRIPVWLAHLSIALLFGALHVNWATLDGLVSFLPLTVLALVFSLAYERTGTIGTTMVAHALFNLNTFVLVATGAGF